MNRRTAGITSAAEAGRPPPFTFKQRVNRVQLGMDYVRGKIVQEARACGNRTAVMKGRGIPGVDVHTDFDIRTAGQFAQSLAGLGILKDG